MTAHRAPYLRTSRDGDKVCSLCGQVFPADVHRSVSRAFNLHAGETHMNLSEAEPVELEDGEAA